MMRAALRGFVKVILAIVVLILALVAINLFTALVNATPETRMFTKLGIVKDGEARYELLLMPYKDYVIHVNKGD